MLSLKNCLKKIWYFVLDWVFPIECFSCGQEGRFLCSDCQAKIELSPIQYCPICRQQTVNGVVCSHCQSHSFLSGAVVAASYEDKLIDQAIHLLKYKKLSSLAEPLSAILVNILQENTFWKNDWLVVPVPLHRRRQNWRGFNQSALIGQQVAQKLGLKFAPDLLRRVKMTVPQIKLQRGDRLQNIVGAFSFNNLSENKITGVILIDDVMTTGGTLQECAKVLKTAGIKNIWGAVLARGN